MSVYQSNRPAPFSAIATLRIVTAVERIVDGLDAWRSRRATHTALSALTDKQLSDIGLHRGDIAVVAEDLARR